jgi:hypothetical protein
MGSKIARSLVKMSVFASYAIEEFLTPAIATDLISDMLKRRGNLDPNL